jgi:hypothetical protein
MFAAHADVFAEAGGELTLLFFGDPRKIGTHLKAHIRCQLFAPVLHAVDTSVSTQRAVGRDDSNTGAHVSKRRAVQKYQVSPARIWCARLRHPQFRVLLVAALLCKAVATPASTTMQCHHHLHKRGSRLPRAALWTWNAPCRPPTSPSAIEIPAHVRIARCTPLAGQLEACCKPLSPGAARSVARENPALQQIFQILLHLHALLRRAHSTGLVLCDVALENVVFAQLPTKRGWTLCAFTSATKAGKVSNSTAAKRAPPEARPRCLRTAD